MQLSVVIPVFDSVSFVARTLHSVLEQEYVPQVVVVDDGSTDGSPDLLLALLDRSPPALGEHRFFSMSHRGVSAARNLGLEASEADYVLFLDSDDLLAPELSRVVAESLLNSSPDVISWGWSYGKESWAAERSHISSDPAALISGAEALRRRARGSLKLWTSSVAFSRSFLIAEGLRFYEGCTSGEDMEFIYRALGRARDVLTTPHLLAHYVNRHDSASNRADLGRFQSVYALDRAFAELGSSSSDAVRDIATEWRAVKLVRNFDFTFASLNSSEAWSTSAELEVEIERAYPGMMSYITELRSGVVKRKGPQ